MSSTHRGSPCAPTSTGSACTPQCGSKQTTAIGWNRICRYITRPALSDERVHALYTKGQNTSVTGVSAEIVFSDGTSTEMVSISGDTAGGYTASLTITVA